MFKNYVPDIDVAALDFNVSDLAIRINVNHPMLFDVSIGGQFGCRLVIIKENMREVLLYEETPTIEVTVTAMNPFLFTVDVWRVFIRECIRNDTNVEI